MQIRKYLFWIPILTGAMVLCSLLLFKPATDANAQCGSQASSCKNCHEVQGQFPVNNDGTGWHQSHAFGDFCYICHAGNNQSMEIDEAHAGMVPPLSDVKAGCQTCHPNDYLELAEVYATALGVEIGTGGGTTGSESNTGSGGAATSENSPAANPPAPAGIVIESSNEVIDYNQLYEQDVLGVRSVNVGNVILILMITAVAVGGGTFIYYNERKRQGKPFLPTSSQADAVIEKTLPIPHIEGYSDDVTALLPKIAQLNPIGLKALQRVLENPDEANEMLHSLSRLDPDLMRRIRSLDRESRALLLALSGD